MKPENGFDKRPQDINKRGNHLGTRHMTTILKEAIKRVSDEGEEPADLIIVKKTIEDAKRGDRDARKLIWNYLDGMPKQMVGGDEENPIKIEHSVTFVDGNERPEN